MIVQIARLMMFSWVKSSCVLVGTREPFGETRRLLRVNKIRNVTAVKILNVVQTALVCDCFVFLYLAPHPVVRFATFRTSGMWCYVVMLRHVLSCVIKH
jgi:hypothetical protein